MFLRDLSLFNFKNYEGLKLEFSSQINCLAGPNGSGKTNLLDAVHYLSMTKSALNPMDQQNIRHGEELFSIKGTFWEDPSLENTRTEIICAFQEGKKKILKADQVEYDKLSEHIGRFPVIMMSPDDNVLIREWSEVRRKFFDSFISQLDQAYLMDLMHYNRLLKQRNALLKHFAERRTFSKEQLAPYGQQMDALAGRIYNKRAQFSKELSKCFDHHYQNISGQAEHTQLEYQSELEKYTLLELFEKSKREDRIQQRSTRGIHKDDYFFSLEGKAMKKFASQGQQKSFLIAIKLAQYQLIMEKSGKKPILLLDDIFDKLDDHRIFQLIDNLSNHGFGQLFISDARPERSFEILKRIEGDKAYFGVRNGKAERLDDTAYQHFS